MACGHRLDVFHSPISSSRSLDRGCLNASFLHVTLAFANSFLWLGPQPDHTARNRPRAVERGSMGPGESRVSLEGGESAFSG